MIAGAVSHTGGLITSLIFFKISESSTAIKLVVCLLHPDGAAIPASSIFIRSSLGTCFERYFPL